MICMPLKAWCRGSYFPGPHVLNSAFVASSSAGESATMRTDVQIGVRPAVETLADAGANESSTDEWHSAHVTPTM
jgi:hypothetical protein